METNYIAFEDNNKVFRVVLDGGNILLNFNGVYPAMNDVRASLSEDDWTEFANRAKSSFELSILDNYFLRFSEDRKTRHFLIPITNLDEVSRTKVEEFIASTQKSTHIDNDLAMSFYDNGMDINKEVEGLKTKLYMNVCGLVKTIAEGMTGNPHTAVMFKESLDIFYDFARGETIQTKGVKVDDEGVLRLLVRDDLGVDGWSWCESDSDGDTDMGGLLFLLRKFINA